MTCRPAGAAGSAAQARAAIDGLLTQLEKLPFDGQIRSLSEFQGRLRYDLYARLQGLAMAADVERWLRHEPVHARAVTWLERLGKWVRRRPAMAAMTLLAALLFAGGVSGIAWQWRRATENARVAEGLAAKESAVSATGSPPLTAPTSAIGRRVPNVVLQNPAGELVGLADLRDRKLVVITFVTASTLRMRPFPVIKRFPTPSTATCQAATPALVAGPLSPL